MSILTKAFQVMMNIFYFQTKFQHRIQPIDEGGRFLKLLKCFIKLILCQAGYIESYHLRNNNNQVCELYALSCDIEKGELRNQYELIIYFIYCF